MTNLQSLDLFWPELIITGVILTALIVDLCIEKSKSDVVGWVLVIGLLITAIAIWNQDKTTTTLFTDMIVLDPFVNIACGGCQLAK